MQCIKNYLSKRLAHLGEKTGIEKDSSSLAAQPETGHAVPINDQSHILGIQTPQTKSQAPRIQYLPTHKDMTELRPNRMDQNAKAGSQSRIYSTSTPHSFTSHAFDMSKGPILWDRESRMRGPTVTLATEQYSDPEHEVSLKSGKDGSAHIFRPLEDYIVASFTSKECINTSFTTSRPLLASCAASECTKRARGVFTDDRHLQSSMQLSEMDAKTLLLGDFAENGSWWTGDDELRTLPGRSQPCQKNSLVEVLTVESDTGSQKSPRIDWTQLSEWYHMVLHAGSEWKQHLHDIVHQNPSDAMYERLSRTEIDEIGDQILEAQSHAQRVLLKATESLLKRPGAPLKEPSDIRFLLIILANPLLYPSTTSSDQARHSRSSSQSIECLPSNTASNPLQLPCGASSTLPTASSYDHGRGAWKHSGIIKRILGLLSNLPNECHHHLVAWFSRFSDRHFEKIVELVGSFVTYRLMRRKGKQRDMEQDPIAALVPSLDATGLGASAALHPALGASGQHKKRPDKSRKLVIYSDDWQIKAAARVMALLFSANHTGTVGHQRSHQRDQIVATSTFYNTLLDYCDLIADFEAWESRRGKFAFCQYPFFLSIWAKIQIMEYDARRQMEVKAREAFFDSIMTRTAVNQYLVLRIRRDCLVEDSLKGVSEVVGSGSEEIKKGLRIEFKGEEGIDAGGLRKEWFLLLVREVFNPEHGEKPINFSSDKYSLSHRNVHL
jgi:E3 ubiquitin-protein ligase HECTD2